MFIISNGCCAMSNHDWENIINDVKKGKTYLKAFKDELELFDCSLNEIYSLDIKGFQRNYFGAYSELTKELIDYHKNKKN